MIAAACFLVALLAFGYAGVVVHRQALARRDAKYAAAAAALRAEHEEQIEGLTARISALLDVRAINAATIGMYKHLRTVHLDRERDQHNSLVVEQARADRAEEELARIAAQVEGKCLWPTLAEQDVVVQYPRAVPS